MSGDLPPVVEFKDVEKTFAAGTPKAFTALRDVNFKVEDKPDEGEFIALIGPSGCGKSTILNLIQGFPVWPTPQRSTLEWFFRGPSSRWRRRQRSNASREYRGWRRVWRSGRSIHFSRTSLTFPNCNPAEAARSIRS